MVIFAADSSGKTASCGVFRDGETLSNIYSDCGLAHSTIFVPMASKAIEESGLEPRDIDLFAVCAGPGSFTGLRIGISAVKAMAWTSGKPCAAVSTLEALAWGAAPYGSHICCALDARAGRVFHALFDIRNGIPQRISNDEAIDLDKLSEKIKNSEKQYIFVGDGAHLCYNAIRSVGGNGVIGADETLTPRAPAIAMAASRMAESGELTDSFSLAPIYLQRPQAERERLMKIGGIDK